MFEFWKLCGFKAAREELIGSSTRKLAVAESSDKTNRDWDATINLDYVGGLGKEILVHMHRKRLVNQQDTWCSRGCSADANADPPTPIRFVEMRTVQDYLLGRGKTPTSFLKSIGELM